MKIQHDSEILKEGQQVITACAFIHNEFKAENGDKVVKLFMPRRAESKKFLPGVFEIPGGHLDFGEEIIPGLKREIIEEFGMEISVGDPFYAFTYVNEIKKAHAVEIIYFAKFASNLSEVKLNPEDHSEFIWVSEKKVDEIIASGKHEDDLEIKGIRRGFELLGNGQLNFG